MSIHIAEVASLKILKGNLAKAYLLVSCKPGPFFITKGLFQTVPFGLVLLSLSCLSSIRQGILYLKKVI